MARESDLPEVRSPVRLDLSPVGYHTEHIEQISCNWSITLPVPWGNLRQEVHSDAHKLIGFFQVGSMPTLLDYHEI